MNHEFRHRARINATSSGNDNSMENKRNTNILRNKETITSKFVPTKIEIIN